MHGHNNLTTELILESNTLYHEIHVQYSDSKCFKLLQHLRPTIIATKMTRKISTDKNFLDQNTNGHVSDLHVPLQHLA